MNQSVVGASIVASVGEASTGGTEESLAGTDESCGGGGTETSWGGGGTDESCGGGSDESSEDMGASTGSPASSDAGGVAASSDGAGGRFGPQHHRMPSPAGPTASICSHDGVVIVA